ncbi:MAG: hypothetical protein ACO28Z_04915 [Opitutales bacterium]
MKPSRLQTLLLMMPTWAFAHAVLIFRVLPLDPKGTALIPTGAGSYAVLYFKLLVAIAMPLLASFVAARRATVLGWSLPPVLGLLIHVPFAGAGLALWLAATGDDTEGEAATPTAMAGRLAVPFVLATAVTAALTAGMLALADMKMLPAGLEQTGGYFGWALFCGLPFAIGVTTGVKVRRAGGSFGQAHAAAFTLLGAILLILCGCAMEGIICVFMAAPFGAGITFVGASLGHLLAKQRIADGRLQSAAWLSIVAMVALEGWNPPAPLEDTTSSEIVIDAPAERVWAQLHDIRDLPPTENILFQFGVAHPMGTATDGQGVGAARLCKLSTGDMPEIVTVWKPGQELRFKVLSTPPSMRELGFFGKTIDAAHLHSAYASLDGGFKLEPLPGGRTRLIGESHYLLNLSPASYWNLWTKEIVRMVQGRVLEHVKQQAEKSPQA